MLGKLTSSSTVKLLVFGSFSAGDVRLEAGSLHTYGIANVRDRITVLNDSFFTAHGPIKAGTIYSNSKDGFGFVRVSCERLIDATGEDHDGYNRQGDIIGEVLGLNAAKELGVAEPPVE